MINFYRFSPWLMGFDTVRILQYRYQPLSIKIDKSLFIENTIRCYTDNVDIWKWKRNCKAVFHFLESFSRRQKKKKIEFSRINLTEFEDSLFFQTTEQCMLAVQTNTNVDIRRITLKKSHFLSELMNCLLVFSPPSSPKQTFRVKKEKKIFWKCFFF